MLLFRVTCFFFRSVRMSLSERVWMRDLSLERRMYTLIGRQKRRARTHTIHAIQRAYIYLYIYTAPTGPNMFLCEIHIDNNNKRTRDASVCDRAASLLRCCYLLLTYLYTHLVSFSHLFCKSSACNMRWWRHTHSSLSCLGNLFDLLHRLLIRWPYIFKLQRTIKRSENRKYSTHWFRCVLLR